MDSRPDRGFAHHVLPRAFEERKTNGASPGSNSGVGTDAGVEVFSWWTGGGEAGGLQDYIEAG
jgi:hypothetical protein